MRSAWPVAALLSFYGLFWCGVGYLAGVAHEGQTTERAVAALERCVHAAVRADSVLRSIDTALSVPQGAQGRVGP